MAKRCNWLVLFLGAIMVMAQVAMAQVTYTLNSKGLATLNYAGDQFVRMSGTTAYGNFEPSVTMTRLDGTTYTINVWSTGQYTRVMDYTNSTITWTEGWGTITCKYTAEANKLLFTVKVTNESDSETVTAFSCALMQIRFPGGLTPTGWNNSDPPKADNTLEPAALLGDYTTGKVVLCNEDVVVPATTRFSSRYYDGYPVSHTAIKPNIGPGQSAVYKVTLRFGTPSDSRSMLISDIITKATTKYSPILNWTDRRPIGRCFMATPATPHPVNNPRGWFNNDATINVNTPEGIAAFQTKVLQRAQTCVNTTLSMNGQAVLVWDLEGQQFPHAISYLGDPTSLPAEMESIVQPDNVKLVDKFFKTITDAGLRAGLTIRPTRPMYKVYSTTGNPTHMLEYDWAQSIIDRISYAKTRWGCTVFYIDSNAGSPYSGAFPADQFRRIAQAHPDCLIIPEFVTLYYYASTARYTDENVSGKPTSASVREYYPNAFSVIQAYNTYLTNNYATFVDGVRNGDILFFDAWWSSPHNATVTQIYLDAGL